MRVRSVRVADRLGDGAVTGQSGQQSFEDFVRARSAMLSRVAYLLTGDHHLAEDLVQQTLLRVADRWPGLVARGDPEAYVRRVLYHQHVSWWRRRESRHIPQEPSSIDGPDPLADRADDVALTLAVREALARLAPRQRAVLVLRYFEDLSEARTAEILGISVGTVKSHARDGLARLRALAPDLDSVMEAQS